ncbi:MAG: agmatine/peptidylarginine deiminase [Cohaesibacteraceae bacterium]
MTTNHDDLHRRSFLAALVGAATLGPLSQKAVAMGPALTRQARFFVPDEAEPHTRTFMQWPVSRVVHPDAEFLRYCQETIADIANAISDFEPVVMLMAAEHEAGARQLLSQDIDIWPIPTEDLWARDSGPLFAVDGRGGLAVRQLNFNGWGGRQVHTNDGRVAERVAERMGLPLLDNGLVGEPGGVESDGHGTLMAHESSWVNANRNSQSREEIEALLLEAYGASGMIWAPGIAGEDVTDYHIDSLARFAGPGRVIIQMPGFYDRNDPWNIAAHETHDILADAQDAEGRPLEMLVIEEPERVRVRSDDFVASYVNYYVCNGAVICAQFGDGRADGAAREQLATAYPGREIVMLDADILGEVGGGIHCATREQPLV